ncbi:MAG: YciI family protein [Gemmatimonadales bacterium]
MVIVKADKDSEAGIMPDEKMLSSKGARVRFSGKKRTVIDGPFAESKELIAGFWLWQVKSMEEAIEWVKRCSNPQGVESEMEIRRVFEAEDFGPEFTPELREQEARLRAEAAATVRTGQEAQR